MTETAQQSMSGIPVISCLRLPTLPRKRWRNYTEQELRVPRVELLVIGKIFSDRRKWEQVVSLFRVFSGRDQYSRNKRPIYCVFTAIRCSS